MDYVYRVCALKHSNGTNVIIGSAQKCLTPTNQCFSKDPKDIINAVQSRSQLKKQPIAQYKAIDKYFEQRGNKIVRDERTNFEEKTIETTDG